MAQAKFHMHQRVFVKPLGTWANVQSIVPQWVKGLGEPLRVSYDLGLGRGFAEEELEAEKPGKSARAVVEEPESLDNWRVLRGHNRCSPVDATDAHPMPGTHPRIVTDERDWGGWRVPAAEYDRNPDRFEFQARLIAAAPRLMELTKSLARIDTEKDRPLGQLARLANSLLSNIYATEEADGSGTPDPSAGKPDRRAATG